MSDLRQHLTDFSGAAVASALATGADGLVFAGLTALSLGWGEYTIGICATLAAAVGAVIHYTLCRFWVFRRFEASLTTSIPLYAFMSGSAGLLHGVLTQVFAAWLVVGFAWFASKALVYALWTYPFSRWVVFTGSGDTDGEAGPTPAVEEAAS